VTVDISHGSTPAVIEAGIPDDMMVGMEDLSAEDIRVPRLRIMHTEKLFKDTLTGVEYEELRAVILGVTKQRIFWASEVEDDDKPLCKSPDHEHGFPLVDPTVPEHKRFPWHLSAFNSPGWQRPSTEPEMNGHVVLPCHQCNLKEWGNEGGKRKPPPCAEQFSYAMLYGAPDEEPSMPAILTLQRSGMAAAKTYNSFFVAQGKPFFTFETKLGLDQQKRGTVKYCTPVLQRLGPTDAGMWRGWSEQARSIREFLRQVPRANDDGTDQVTGTVTVSNENAAPPQAAPPAPAPAPQAEPPAASAEPVAAEPAPAPAQAPAPTPAPVPAPAPAPVVVPAAPAAPVTAPATPAPQVTPPPTPPAPTPAQAPQPTAQAVPADSADDLPF
jgi:hypothetical protein